MTRHPDDNTHTGIDLCAQIGYPADSPARPIR